ncbi:hypothetical protein KZZ52_46665 [Dactylosporangium sp. AC04546]|uniref:hypothetical protein n=1 Tax=Dactylosporangium sp. AC04546 TaxID=2862460 RepID=UPI001EDFCE13|nr:hypothetical protein [Dactylosporangium sp. AC04546]WVK81398.1 hypothetical protein KZZ52_46665 [Dactylosporangium sp. AC04546]
MALAVLAGFAVPGTAAAHPFGDPQTVAVGLGDARPDVVRVRWRVGGLDDLTLLGVSLGILPKDRVMLDGAVFYRDADAAAIAPSPAFASYLLDRIVVSTGGRACPGTVQPVQDLAKRGVTVDFACPGPVGVASVAVRTLTDLHPAYQTLATGPDGQRTVYRQGAESHDWPLGDVPATPQASGSSAVIQLTAVIAGVLVAIAVVWLVARRMRRRRAVA